MTDQNSQFFAILTAVGEAKQANANALGVPWTFAQMGVGDANLTDPIPSRTQTRLINERRRAALNTVKVDPGNASIIIAEQVIPPDVGGWWIREIGLYDAAGDLVAVANCAPSFKPLLSQGTGKTQVVRLNIIVTSTANIQLKIDPAVVLATREYVDAQLLSVLPPNKAAGQFTKVRIDERGVVIEGFNPGSLAGLGISFESQAGAEEGTATDKPMNAFLVMAAFSKRIAKIWIEATETVYGVLKIATQQEVDAGANVNKAVTPVTLKARLSKALADLWVQATEVRYGVTRLATQEEVNAGTSVESTVTPATLQKKVSDLWVQATETVFGVLKIATQQEVDAGANVNKAVTPVTLKARLSKALADLWVQATEAAFGVVKIATQSEVDAGTNGEKVITPVKMRSGFSASFTPRGHIALPSWLGGFIINWGLETGIPAATSSSGSVGPTRDATMSLAFPTTVFGAICSMQFTSMDTTAAMTPGVLVLSPSVVRVQNNYTASAGSIFWVVMGK